MESVRLIGQTADFTFAEVTFGSHYRGSATITHASHVVVSWIDNVINMYAPPAGTNSHIYVGIHVECTPPYSTIALIELCVGNACLVYQLQHRNDSDPPVRLNDFLSDDRFCFIGVDVDLIILHLRTVNRCRVTSAIDLGQAASRRLQREDLRWAGLDLLLWEVMRIVIIRPDGARRNALFERVLPLELVGDACIDAIFSHEIGRILLR